MAEIAELAFKTATTLGDLGPGECFITAYDYERSGREAKVWMKIQTRYFNPNDEKKPKIGWMTVNLATGINGGHTLTAPVYRVKVEITPTIYLD